MSARRRAAWPPLDRDDGRLAAAGRRRPGEDAAPPSPRRSPRWWSTPMSKPTCARRRLPSRRLLRGERYAKLLADVADQAELEGTPLLAAATAELRRQRGVDN